MDSEDLTADPAEIPVQAETPAEQPEEILRDLTAADVAAVRDFSTERVPVPEWNGAVYVRTLTADQRDDFVTRFIASETGRMRTNVRTVTATLLAMTVCDKNGVLLFENIDTGREVFGDRAALNVDPLFDVAMKKNKLSADDIEELAGN